MLLWSSYQPYWTHGQFCLFPRRAIPSLPWTVNVFPLSSFFVSELCLWSELTFIMLLLLVFARIMGDFPWMPLVKQVEPTGGTVPSSTIAPVAREGGQPTVEVGLVIGAAEVAPSSPSSILAKMMRDDGARVSGRKKSRAPLSLRALRQVIRLTPDVGCHSSVQDVPSASPIVEASIVVDVVIVTSVPPPLSVVLVREATLIVAEESAPVSLASFVVASLSTVAAPLLSVSVVTTNALVVPSSSSSTHMVPPPTTLASTYTSSHPRVSLNHIYTSNDDDSLWGMGYKHK